MTFSEQMTFVATLLLRPLPRPAYAFSTTPPETEDVTHISAGLLSDFFTLCQTFNLETYHSSLSLLDHERLGVAKVAQLTVLGSSDIETNTAEISKFKASKELRDLEYTYNVDVAVQRDTVFRRYKRLVVFDMDSTLIQQEVIDEIAAFVGVKPQVAEITERAMRGELDFSESLRSRCALLKDVPSTVFETLKTNGTITFTPGAHDLCTALKRLGCKLAVLSGGFQPLADWVKESLSLDYAFANTLEVSPDGTKLTGQVLGEIVNAERKAALLLEIARKEGIDINQVVAVGDGANDLVMMREAGFGVAFNAKPKVQDEAPAHVNTTTLQDILYLFGFDKPEQEQLINPGPLKTKL
ncbi:hypothetical protein ABW20_dc0101033 [Dactylellina cionopaga]|nr:hypothetical protein ABW20_dc0101033 [Dactylellina cionopaga]